MQKAVVVILSSRWFCVLSFVMSVVFSYWFSFRLIKFGGAILSADMFVLPFVFLFLCFIVEKNKDNSAYKYMAHALLAHFIFVGYGMLITCFSSPSYAVYNYLYDFILKPSFSKIFIFQGSFLLSIVSAICTFEKCKYTLQMSLFSRWLIASSVGLLIFNTFDFLVFYMISVGNKNFMILVMQSIVEIIVFTSLLLLSYIKIKKNNLWTE